MSNPLAAAIAIQDSALTQRSTGGGATSFAGAGMNRMTMDWVLASIRSADQEVRSDVRTLRARSRELVRNNDTASRFVSLVDEQTIGDQGIRLQAQVKRPDGTLDKGINRQIEDAWAEWCEPGNCTVDGRMGWNDVLSNAATAEPQDGEWIARLLPFRNRFGFALNILDPDQLDHELNRPRGEQGAEIRMGVEIDAWRRPIAFWVFDGHPSEYALRERERRRLPADQIVHLFRSTRVAQTRGVPWFTPALMKLHFLEGYEEAELVAARVASAKGGFFERVAESAGDPNAPNAETQQQLTWEVAPGVADALPVGWSFKEWDPKHPTDAFESFYKAMLRGIANGLNVSYTSLANDLTDVNFSSIRAGLLNERDAWRKLQNRLIRHFCTRVYRAWFDWAVTTGALNLPLRNMDRWKDHRWLARGYPWVDPQKDIDAAASEIRLGVNSRTRICAQRGLDFEEVLEDLRNEEMMAEDMGVSLSTDMSKGGSSDTEDDSEPAARNRIVEHLSGNGRH